MANTPPVSQLNSCPSCEEPLEEGDLFCGACGADLAAPAPAPAPAAAAPAAAAPAAKPQRRRARRGSRGRAARLPGRRAGQPVFRGTAHRQLPHRGPRDRPAGRRGLRRVPARHARGGPGALPHRRAGGAAGRRPARGARHRRPGRPGRRRGAGRRSGAARAALRRVPYGRDRRRRLLRALRPRAAARAGPHGARGGGRRRGQRPGPAPPPQRGLLRHRRDRPAQRRTGDGRRRLRRRVLHAAARTRRPPPPASPRGRRCRPRWAAGCTRNRRCTRRCWPPRARSTNWPRSTRR